MTISASPQQIKLSIANPMILLDFLQEQGHCQHAIFSGTTINSELFTSTDNQISISEYRQLIQKAIQLTNNPLIGLEFGQRLSFTGHSNLGFGALASETFKELLIFIQRCAPVLNPAIEFALSEDERFVHFHLKEAVEWGNTDLFMVDTAFSMLTVAVRMFDAKVAQQLCYKISHSANGLESTYHEYLPGEVLFDQPHNIISFPAEFCYKPLGLHNPSAVKQAESLLQKHLEKIGNTYFEMQSIIRGFIANNPGQFPTLEDVAKAFHVSPRTLNRRFKAIGTQFKDVVNETKKQIAEEYLTDGKSTVVDISYQLGYSDPSNFSKAFKSWTGLTPTQYIEARKGSSPESNPEG